MRCPPFGTGLRHARINISVSAVLVKCNMTSVSCHMQLGFAFDSSCRQKGMTCFCCSARGFSALCHLIVTTSRTENGKLDECVSSFIASKDHVLPCKGKSGSIWGCHPSKAASACTYTFVFLPGVCPVNPSRMLTLTGFKLLTERLLNMTHWLPIQLQV